MRSTSAISAARGALLEEALGLARQLDYKYGMAIMRSTLGFVAVKERAYGPARSLLEQAQALTQQLGNDFGMAYCLWGLAALAQRQHDYITARVQFSASLAAYRSIGANAGAVDCIERLAQVHAALGEAGEAVRLGGAAAKWRGSTGVPMAPVEPRTTSAPWPPR